MPETFLILDAVTIFNFHKDLKERNLTSGNIDYGHLTALLGGNFDKMVALTAIDKEHQGQKKFCEYLQKLGYTVDSIDYRETFIGDSRRQSLSTRLTYILGLLANKEAIVTIVSNAYEIQPSLLDFIDNRLGQVTLAFFKSGLENRWSNSGLFQETSRIRFKNLDVDSKKILGIDLHWASPAQEGENSLSKFLS